MIRWPFSEKVYLNSSGKIIQDEQLYAYAVGKSRTSICAFILLKSTYLLLICSQQTSVDSTI